MQTFTAMYADRADAERVQAELQRLGIIDTDGMNIHDQGSAGLTQGSGSGQSAGSGGSQQGFWANLKGMFLPDEDRHTYEEGMRRGHYLLTVNVDDQHADRVHDILENSNAIDVDEHAGQWRQQGWTAPATGTTAGSMGASSAAGMTAAAAGGVASARAGAEERIPIVEEQLAVGKREVSRGGVRVRSYVREVPVHEQVRLREEHVDVERRPVNRPLAGDALAGDAFRERSVEVTETAEEAVVAKNARVVEEVVVRKGVGERVEEIDDTVRRTEVDVERLADNDRTGTDRLAARDGGLGSDGLGSDPNRRDRLS